MTELEVGEKEKELGEGGSQEGGQCGGGHREMIHGKNVEVRLTREGYKVSGCSLLLLPLFACKFGKPPEMELGGTFWCLRPA